MMLAIDVGNTNIKVGVYREGKWENRWLIRTLRNMTADEYGVTFHSFLRQSNIAPAEIDRAVLSSVVPPVVAALNGMLQSLIGKEALVVAPGVRTGLRIRTDNPVEVGSDIVAGAVAAYERFQTHCIVVGFGTALTFTAVAEPGDLLGVSIAPGLKYAAEALFEHTAQLQLVKLEPPSSAIGRNTVQSIQSGIIFGYVGMVESLIGRIQSELPGPAKVIATGGQARLIAPLTECFTEIDPWLTLEGLRIISERNME